MTESSSRERVLVQIGDITVSFARLEGAIRGASAPIAGGDPVNLRRGLVYGRPFPAEIRAAICSRRATKPPPGRCPRRCSAT
jgi:hypothetical protein